MRYQDDVITFLKELAANVNYFPGIGWWHFRYGSYQMVYIPTKDTLDIIRLCIPHFDDANQYNSERLSIAVNETNREVKYVKVVILCNGSISINYDHKYDGENDIHPNAFQYAENPLFRGRILEK